MKLFNEETAFKLNESPTEELLEFGDLKVLVVDNFYENPDIIREGILGTPATYFTPDRPPYPGRHIDIRYDLSSLSTAYKNLISKYFKLNVDVDKSLSKHSFLVNVLQSEHSDPNPHIDDTKGYASSIYFNIDEECSGGLDFYDFDNNKLGTVDMKYNRMLLYQQFVKHVPYIPEGSFTGDLHRINQQLFI